MPPIPFLEIGSRVPGATYWFLFLIGPVALAAVRHRAVGRALRFAGCLLVLLLRARRLQLR